MSKLEIVCEGPAGGEVTFQLRGTLDREGAHRLNGLLGACADQEVLLDFSHLREFLDLSVPILARGLNHPHLRVRGLGSHPERLFRYFGVFAQTVPVTQFFDPANLTRIVTQAAAANV